MNKRTFLKRVLMGNAILASILILSPKYKWEIRAYKNDKLIMSKSFVTDNPSYIDDKDIVEMCQIEDECEKLGYKNIEMTYHEYSNNS